MYCDTLYYIFLLKQFFCILEGCTSSTVGYVDCWECNLCVHMEYSRTRSHVVQPRKCLKSVIPSNFTVCLTHYTVSTGCLVKGGWGGGGLIVCLPNTLLLYDEPLHCLLAGSNSWQFLESCPFIQYKIYQLINH